MKRKVVMKLLCVTIVSAMLVANTSVLSASDGVTRTVIYQSQEMQVTVTADSVILPDGQVIPLSEFTGQFLDNPQPAQPETTEESQTPTQQPEVPEQPGGDNTNEGGETPTEPETPAGRRPKERIRKGKHRRERHPKGKHRKEITRKVKHRREKHRKRKRRKGKHRKVKIRKGKRRRRKILEQIPERETNPRRTVLGRVKQTVPPKPVRRIRQRIKQKVFRPSIWLEFRRKNLTATVRRPFPQKI